MIWGFAGPWHGDLCDTTRPVRLMARLEALAGFGIRMASAHLAELAQMDEAQIDRLSTLAGERIHLGWPPRCHVGQSRDRPLH